MKKYVAVFLAVCLLALALFGCASKELTLVEQQWQFSTEIPTKELLMRVNNWKPAEWLITKEYTMSGLVDNCITDNPWGKYELTFYLEDFSKANEVEFLRSVKASYSPSSTVDGRYYTMYRIRNVGWLYVFFFDFLQHEVEWPEEDLAYAEAHPNTRYPQTHAIFISDALDKTALRAIKVGDRIEDVKKADPAATLNQKVGGPFVKFVKDGYKTIHWCNNELYVFSYSDDRQTVTDVTVFKDGVYKADNYHMFDYNILRIDWP